MNTDLKRTERSTRNRESGFTLIEMIAVLIILGILAAVAVPKYFNISEQAKEKAFESAISQGMSLSSLAYAKAAVDAAGEPEVQDVYDALVEDGVPNIEGDFNYTFAVNTSAGGCDGIDITVTGKTGTPFEGFTEEGETTPGMTRTWCLP